MVLRQKNSIQEYFRKIEKLKCKIEKSEAILINANSGFLKSTGFVESEEKFRTFFSDFEEKYHFHSISEGEIYKYQPPEEYWAYLSQFIYYNRYDLAPKKAFKDLFLLLKNKNYFIITVDMHHQFQTAGFDETRLFCEFGDYGLFQCSKHCHKKTYSNEKIIRKMLSEQINMKVPSGLIPTCPKCAAPMEINYIYSKYFVKDKSWRRTIRKYAEFLYKYSMSDILFWDLGVGGSCLSDTYLFWEMTDSNPNSTYACVDIEDKFCPSEIEDRSIYIKGDISKVLQALLISTNGK